MKSPRIPVAILGATGAVGQRMIQLLENHPWFEIAVLTGSDRTIGRPYGELVRWVLDGAPPLRLLRDLFLLLLRLRLRLRLFNLPIRCIIYNNYELP